MTARFYSHEDDVLDIIYREEQTARKRKARLSVLQKLIGLLCIALSVADAILLQDLTLGVVFVPTGLYAIFTREVIL